MPPIGKPLSALALLVVLAGCRPAGNLAATEATLPPTVAITETAPVELTAAPLPETPSVVPDALAEQQTAQARAQLAQKLGIALAEISLFSVEAVEWPDASLGCPQPGMVYAQVVTPGYQILLEAAGIMYSFHSDEAQRVILCEARPPDEIYNPP